MADLFRNRFRIPTARAPWWNYGSDAAYFVTICTHGRQHFFGEVVDGTMMNSPLGQIANECWQKLPEHFPFIHLDEFVVMPNHVHGIIVIDHNGIGERLHASSLLPDSEKFHATSLPKNEVMAAISPKTGSLATIIRSYKSAVSRLTREIHVDFAWQTRYHDHIIRDPKNHDVNRYYILNNPLTWDEDRFNL